MYFILPRSVVFLVLSLMISSGFAQNFTGTYDFSGVTTTSGRTDPTPVTTAPGVTFGNFMAIAPAGNPNALSANPNATGRFSFTGWPTGATNGSDVFTGSINTGQYDEVTLTPQTNFRLTLNTITFTLQRSATGNRQYAVRSSADGFTDNLTAVTDPANTNLKVVSGNIFQVADAATTAQDGSKITLAGLTNLSGPVTFRFYGWNAEASGGTFSIDNVQFSGTAVLDATAPALTISTASLHFPLTGSNTTAALTYTILGENLTGPVLISTAAPFTVSDHETGPYATSLNIPAADVTTAKTIYVHFSPLAIGIYTGTIVHASSGAGSKSISISGEANDPDNLTFGFNACTSGGTPGSGFLSYSVTGVQQWACSNFGLNSTHGVDMNGYSGGAVDNEDWLITPPLHLGSLNLPVLKFWSRGEFTGPSLQLLISTDYDGNSNPNTATWTDLQASFPPLTNVWTLTDGINLSFYKNNPNLYIAFRYTSSPELGAARWTLDSVDITNRTALLFAGSSALDFGEVATGAHSAGLPVRIQALGFSDIGLTAPAGYELSADNSAYGSALPLTAAQAEAGTTVYVRFAPVSKSIKITGSIRFTGTGLDSTLVALTGSSYPKSETLDVAAYNLSFFGSNPTNNPTPEKITTQINNITTVFQRINMDVVGVEEVSSDSAFAQLLSRLPGYASVLSPRWSYSFDPPDPNFPPQKTGFIYNTATMQLLSQQDLFTGLYDSARNGTTHVLDNYPSGTPSSFWASGRLPFMATFRATVNGQSRVVRVIDIHAKSASDAASYNRRVYDVKVLKDTLDAYYPNDNVILVGDYNDRLSGSINAGAQSPYKPFIDDAAAYTGLTLPLDQAGKVSFVTGTGLIDHIMISNELRDVSIANATDIEDPRAYISGYNATTASDHLPVFTRFNLGMSVLPVQFTRFRAQAAASTVTVNWSTANESGNRYFILERSADGTHFIPYTRLNGSGTVARADYQYVDSFPLKGISYYRLKQVDADGKETLTQVISVSFWDAETFSLVPNLVTVIFNIRITAPVNGITAKVSATDGTLLLQAKGATDQVNREISGQLNRLKPGVYLLQVNAGKAVYTTKFVKQ